MGQQNYKSLRAYELTKELFRGSANNISDRETQQVWIRGFKINGIIASRNAVHTMFHVAIVQDLDKDHPFSSAFFNNNTNDARTQRDFVELDTTDANGTGTNVWSPVYNYAQLNRARYRVIKHIKFRVAAAGNIPDDFRYETMYQYQKVFKMWIPIKRRVQFETASASSLRQPWYMLTWHMPITKSGFETQDTLTGDLATFRWVPIDFNWRIIAYWKDVL